MAISKEIQTYLEHHFQYLYVTEYLQTIIIDIRRAFEIWLDNPTVIFDFEKRIAGTLESIKSLYGYQPKQYISVDNYQSSMVQKYTEELNSYNYYRMTSINSNKHSRGTKLYDLVIEFNPTLKRKLLRQVAEKEQKEPKVEGDGAYEFYTKLKALIKQQEAGDESALQKVFDVSKLTYQGKGLRKTNRLKVPQKGQPVKSKKKTSKALPIMSDNFEAYLLAIRMIPHGEQTYAEDVEYMRGQFNVQSGTSDVPIFEEKDIPVEIAKPVQPKQIKAVSRSVPRSPKLSPRQSPRLSPRRIEDKIEDRIEDKTEDKLPSEIIVPASNKPATPIKISRPKRTPVLSPNV